MSEADDKAARRARRQARREALIAAGETPPERKRRRDAGTGDAGPGARAAEPRRERPRKARPPKPPKPVLSEEERKRRKKAARRGPVGNFFARIGESDFSQRRVAGLMRLMFWWARLVGRVPASRFAGRVARLAARFSKENKVGRENLALAYPEKTPEERERILRGVWDNLAAATIEYEYLSDLVEAFDPDRPTGGVIEHVGIEHVYELRDGGRPGIVFGAHLGNWELSAAIGAKLGVTITAPYRPPANRYVAEEMERRRKKFVGTLVVSGRGAALQVASALQSGKHLGVIIDQRISDGPILPFFGRPSSSNPIVGILARLFDCPVYGVRAIRRPDGGFRLEMTPALDLPRDRRGRVDPDGANRMVHAILEGWIRETPEQWLWLHDRWRKPKVEQKRLANKRARRRRGEPRSGGGGGPAPAEA